MVEMKLEKLDLVKKRFQDMQKKAMAPKDYMDIIGAKAWREVVKNFDLEQNEDGSKWAKFKKGDQRVNTRPTKRGGTKLLRDTGYLRQSIRWIASNIEARVFTKVKYAGYHDHGEGAMHRSFMWISDKLKLQFAMELLQWIKG